jgi:phenylpropionate dioxygenase-like ring-hydroxylating dioxygenase large terminal subunit
MTASPAERSYPLRQWYIAATSAEVGSDAVFSRKLLGTSVVIYRDNEGQAIALHDRCPHRFAPLSLGKREGDELVCPYHALKFDRDGFCTHNPHGKGVLPTKQVVRTFPIVEKLGFLWIWMADEPADLAKLPDFPPLDQGPATGIGHTYMKLPINYRMILDNVMDLSHVDHVHGEIITTRGQLTPLIPEVEENDGVISASWQWEQTPPILILNQFLPRPEEAARHWIKVNWSAPGNIQLSLYCAQDDTPVFEGPGQYDLHSVTPEDENNTHYFFCTRRNHIEDDADYNAMKIGAMHGAFEDEDGPLMIACEREMGGEDFFDLKPMLLSNDLAAVKVRRRLRDLVEQELSDSAASG